MSEISNAFAGEVYIGNPDIDDKNYPIKVILLEQIMPNDLFNSRFIPLLNNTHYVFVGICFYAWFSYFTDIKKEIKKLNPDFNLKNIIFMTNNKGQTEEAINIGFDAIFCNHNAFLDEKSFVINNKIEKIYDCVFNGSPELVKRPYLLKSLAENCKMAIIQGYTWDKEYFWDLSQLSTKFINKFHDISTPESRLTVPEVIDIYNKSKMGVITSESEGGSKVSGEYMLCGLPVLSTLCVGGREVWYNDTNTVICEGSSEGVLEGYKQVLDKIDKGIFNSVEIRKGHLKMMGEFRKTFIDKVGEILALHNVIISDHFKFFEDRFLMARDIILGKNKEGLVFYQRGICYNEFEKVVEILNG